jgi:hypothetical protein
VLPRLLIVKEVAEKRRKRKRKRKRRIPLLHVEGQPDVKIKAIKGGV